MGTGVWSSWQMWALLSAAFAALTAIFAKLGVSRQTDLVRLILRSVAMLG